MNEKKTEWAEVRGGMLGAGSALITFFVVIIAFSLLGIRGSESFWSAGFLSIAVSFFFFKDKDVFQEAVKDGIKNEIFVMSMLAFFFAGILSQILTEGHLVDALVWLSAQINLSAKIIPAITFVICIIIGAASGTSTGTVTTVAPIMLPLAADMGCSVELICGIIISGAFLGNDLAPISDNTIASSMTQEVEMARVYKARMKYSVPIGIVSLILYTVLGFSTTSVSETATMQIGNEYAMNLVYIILPILVVVLMLKGMNLLTSLLYADILGIIMLFVLEGLSLAEAFSSKGVVVNGIKDVIGGTFLIMFGFIVTSITRVTGVLDEIVNVVGKHAKDARSGEVLIGVTQCAFTLVTGSPSASVAIVGPMARQFVKPYHIDRARIANIMNGLAGGIGGMVPHCSTGAMAVSLAISLGATANPNFSTFDCVGYNFYSIGLLLMFWAAILTGWGREFEPNTDEEESL